MWFLAAIAFLALFLGLFPMLVSHPYVEQTPSILMAAYWIQKAGPAVSACLAVIGVVAAYGRAVRYGRRTAMLACLLLVPAIAFVFTSRRYFAEWFFSPARGAQLASIQQPSDVSDNDLVIGVTLDGVSRAYPVRYLAFHHMLNDALGSTHLLPTY
jgi:hypothetical protein